MKEQALLLDLLYRRTFKRPFDFELRKMLADARRIVLSDAMTAFLYSVETEIYTQGWQRPFETKRQWKNWLKRSYARLDDCRHFSRLPHRITWVEYSLKAMLERELAERETKGLPKDQYMPDEYISLVYKANTRIGWLFYQHNTIETAFSAEYFVGVMTPPAGVSHLPAAIIWDTETNPLPFSNLITEPQIYKDGEVMMSPSAFVTGIPGYERFNVGMRAIPPRIAALTSSSTQNLGDRARMMWGFLSTFNKVPIFGEEKIIPSHGFVARGSYHHFLEHKILTINIPEKVGIRRVARDALALIRRRAHGVRGHWRDDYRLPKGNKSLWIPEHERGDRSLGYVVHDYEVKHGEE